MVCHRWNVNYWSLCQRNPLVRTDDPISSPYFPFLNPPSLFWNGVKPVPICRTISEGGEQTHGPPDVPAPVSHSRQHNDFDWWRSADSMTLNWQRRERKESFPLMCFAAEIPIVRPSFDSWLLLSPEALLPELASAKKMAWLVLPVLNTVDI